MATPESDTAPKPGSHAAAMAAAAKVDLRLAVSDDVVGDFPVKIKCREHHDKVQSLAVYPTNIHCFGCGFHEARTVYALAYLLKVDFAEALTVAPKYTNESLDNYRVRAADEARRDPMPGSLALIYNDILLSGRRQQRAEWLKARGLSVASIHGAYLGHDGVRFVIPVFDGSGNLISLRYRRDDAYCDEGDTRTPKYSGTKGRNGFYIYPESLIARHQPETLTLVEGELDALRLWQEGIPAVTATNGAGQAPKVIAYIKEHYPCVRRWLIATDMDEPGREAARIATDEVRRLGMDGEVLAWTGPGKDVTEALLLGSLEARVLRAALAQDLASPESETP